ncbi:hypothetical protein DAI18_12830 [Microvirgula aerodenitrificans]|uniref:Uncharacterized protein n=1 Tax=Microvirgula aerodenitrificans TaxID=57480 RepID=A0A2S0PBV5_9NEIS|nr:hypothetical protein [Microvirgula aerodenitrificans]AVY94825.1 hypothetical protein DAI18_12830 [Microvirgula aerodenitrificans]
MSAADQFRCTVCSIVELLQATAGASLRNLPVESIVLVQQAFIDGGRMHRQSAQPVIMEDFFLFRNGGVRVEQIVTLPAAQLSLLVECGQNGFILGLPGFMNGIGDMITDILLPT